MQTKTVSDEEIFSAELDCLTKPDGSAKFSISNSSLLLSKTWTKLKCILCILYLNCQRGHNPDVCRIRTGRGESDERAG